MHNGNEELTERDESEVLRITTRVIEAAAPPESYWPGYHARLRDRLDQSRRSHLVVTKQPSWIARLFSSSVAVPVPVAAALIVAFTFALFFTRQTPTPSAPQLQVVHVPVEVPVVQEKIVTRVVYRQTPGRTKQKTTAAQNDSTLARTLVGFKPTEEIKLTVIKGGANEK